MSSDESLPSREHTNGLPATPMATTNDAASDTTDQAGATIAPSSARMDPPRRLHPTSLLFDVLSHTRQYLVPAVIAVFSAAQGSSAGLMIAGVLFLPSLIVSVFRYFTLRYHLHGGELIVTEGLLFRRIRTVPVSRVQNIDLVQNVLHRVFGVAEVRVETASGSEPEATLRVLSMTQVANLRNEIFRLRSEDGTSHACVVTSNSVSSGEVVAQESAHAAVSPEDAGETLLEIPTGWLVRAGLASNRGILILGLAVGVLFQMDLEDRIPLKRLMRLLPRQLDSLAVIAAVVAGIVVILLLLRGLGIVWYVLRFSGYRLSRHGEDLRISCGLLTKVSATVPRRRVQFISVHRPLLMRWMGLASIRIETAGGAGKESEDATATVSRRWFVPVVPEDHVERLAGAVRPGFNWNMSDVTWQPLAPRARIRLTRLAVIESGCISAIGFGITQPWGWLAGLIALPCLVWWAAKKSRAMRYTRTEDGVIYRSGVLNRKLSVTFFEKIQALRVEQSPFDRRWKMATLSVDTAAAGPADHRIAVPLLDEDFALGELERLLDRAARQLPIYG